MFRKYAAVIGPDMNEAGHVSVGGYLTIFDRATDCLREHVGLGRTYAIETNHGMYVAEAHIAYERELRAGDAISVGSLVVDVGANKLHLHDRMRHEPAGTTAAEVELIVLHVDRKTGRTALFPEPILARLRALAARHAELSKPPLVGRPLSLRRLRKD